MLYFRASLISGTGNAYRCWRYVYFCVVFQIQPDFMVLALHIDARILFIYSYVVLQIQPDLLLALHIDACI
jgi:hypothetical protein